MRRAETKTEIHDACAAPRKHTRCTGSEPSGSCVNPCATSSAVRPTLPPAIVSASLINVSEYFDLALRQARSFRHGASERGIEWEDLVGEARLALMLAARRFNPARGRSFDRFASSVIRSALARAVGMYGRHLSPTNAGGRKSRLVARPLPDPDAAADVQSLLSHLTAYERTLVEERFGLIDGEERDTRQLAVLRHIKEEQVTRILQRALTMMRCRMGLLAGSLAIRCMGENRC